MTDPRSLLARVHALLTADPDLAPDSLAAALAVDVDAVLTCLDELDRLHLRRPSGPGRPHAVVGPDVAVGSLHDRLARTHASYAARFHQASRDLGDLLTHVSLLEDHTACPPSGPTRAPAPPDTGAGRTGSGPQVGSVTHGPAPVAAPRLVDQVRALLPEARGEVLLIDPDSGTGPPVLGPHDAAGLVASGIPVRWLGLAPTPGRARPTPSASAVSDLVEAGVTVRVRAALPFPLVVVDERVAVCGSPVPLTEGGPGGGILHRNPLTVATLAHVFQHCWLEADPPAPGVAPTTNGSAPLSDEQVRLLRLLLDGATDQVIARHLHTSPRTTTRRIAEVLTLLHAQTRFQAGAAAVRLGLV